MKFATFPSSNHHKNRVKTDVLHEKALWKNYISQHSQFDFQLAPGFLFYSQQKLSDESRHVIDMRMDERRIVNIDK